MEGAYSPSFLVILAFLPNLGLAESMTVGCASALVHSLLRAGLAASITGLSHPASGLRNPHPLLVREGLVPRPRPSQSSTASSGHFVRTRQDVFF